MRLLVRILCLALATSSFAIPLHIGETWTWQVANTWRSARVLDSVPVDTGSAAAKWRKGHSIASLWRLEARDSVSKAMDTGTILAWPDGIQIWMRPSRLLPWEPTSRQLLRDSGLVQNAWSGEDVTLRDAYDSAGDFVFLPTYPWGASLLLTGSKDYYEFGVDLACEWLRLSDVETIYYYPTPIQRLGIAGIELFQSWWELWELVAWDGISQTPLDSRRIAVPESGTAWVWLEHTFGYSCKGIYNGGTFHDRTRLVHDSLLRDLGDSAGWKRIEIREGSDSTVHDHHCRIRRNGLDSLLDCPDPVSYWLRDWKADTMNGWFTSSTQTSFSGYFTDGSSNEYRRVRNDGLLDSSYAHSLKNDHPIYCTSESTTIRTLLSVNGLVMRTVPTSKISAAARTDRKDIGIEAARFPETPMRWHDLAGRTGTFRAGELLKPTASPRLLVLDATFPDGTRWQGKFLTGSGR
jgi:hypothetical protein